MNLAKLYCTIKNFDKRYYLDYQESTGTSTTSTIYIFDFKAMEVNWKIETEKLVFRNGDLWVFRDAKWQSLTDTKDCFIYCYPPSERYRMPLIRYLAYIESLK